jgi:deoxyadenosine/deoxycytidine kinase
VQLVLQTLIAIAIVTVLLMTCSWLSYYQRLRARNRRMTIAESNSNRRYKRIARDPEEQYIEGVGYVIGDLSCTYNARSPYIRCAVNPDGLCQDCRHYHQKTE